MKFALLLLVLVSASVAFRFAPTSMSRSRSLGGTQKMQMSTTEDIGAVGSKLTNLDLAKEAIALWVEEGEVEKVEMEPTSGGVNNIVQYLTLPNGERKLLRIYNNGLDTTRVTFEHEVLQKLHEQYAADLSFKVPYMIPSKNGKTFVKLSNGAEACMVDLIDGGLPKLTCVEDIGRASGELNTVMGKLEGVTATCNCDPYYLMWENHHAVTRENFISTMKGPDFDGKLRPFADAMLEETLVMDEKCEGEYKGLPTQLLHGDLHYDNVLVDHDTGKVTGLLDFEFAMYDWRAMELAICLSKYAGEEDAFTYFDQFLTGYAKTGVMTMKEAEAVPDLINLRILSNVVYFVGRAVAKEDSIASLTTRIENYTNRIKWTKDNADKLVSMIQDKFGLDEASCWQSAKPVSEKFEVKAATDAQMKEMDVTAWPTWTTVGSEKYQVGKKAPTKVYDTNELSYIISGEMDIIHGDTTTTVKAGDFVTFPEGFECNWFVREEITKHWFCYKADGSPDLD